MRELIAGQNEAGQRMDKLLRKYLKNAGSGFLYKMLRKKNIVLNDKRASGQELLKQGDSIKLYFSEETLSLMTGEMSAEKMGGTNTEPSEGAGRQPGEAAGRKGQMKGAAPGKAADREKQYRELKTELISRILYEDAELLILNKPAGWLSQGDGSSAPSVNELCLSYLLSENKLSREQLKTFHPGIANRLDRNTTGLILFGKTLPALQLLARLLRERSLGKYYIAAVSGIVRGSGRIDGYLEKDRGRNQVRISSGRHGVAQEIHTEYEPLFQTGTEGGRDCCTLLRVHLITGKTHQIRSHLASAGHPILGDPKYGSPSVNQYWRRRTGLQHQLLHAYELHFPSIPAGALSALSGQCIKAPLPLPFHPFCQGSEL